MGSTLLPAPEDITLARRVISGVDRTADLNARRANLKDKRPVIRRLSPPPPKDMLALLHRLGHALGISGYVPSKMDLSFSDPLAPVWNDKGYTWRRLEWWGDMSLKGITSMFIHHFYYRAPGGSTPPDLDDLDLLDKVFRRDVVDYLASRGYRPEDVLVWTWILMARDGDEAGLRVHVWSKACVKEIPAPEQESKDEERPEKETDGHSMATGVPGCVDSTMGTPQPDAIEPSSPEGCSHSPPQPITRTPQIPPFLLHFVLRYPTHTLHASTLRLLFPLIHQMLSSPLPSESPDAKTSFLTLIRLLRHARSSWPAAIPMCAELITRIHSTTLPPTPSRRLARTYNRFLSLLSLPTSDRPFKSMHLQQHSQFVLLRKMASLDIQITREGYRALVTIQLAHTKTSTEALYAGSLSSNWPPWPVPKDGHYRSLGHTPRDPHLSRAAQVLRQMAEAGYSHLGWEQEALVLAGTDTDLSPTIQTRTFYRHARSNADKESVNIWAVRVRATRTLEEAWSILLDCINVSNIPSPQVWMEMFGKIISAKKEQRLRQSRQRQLEMIKAAHLMSSSPSSTPTRGVVQALDRWDLIQRAVEEGKRRVLPGDAKEVSLPPASPSEGVYVGVPPPGVEELFTMMKRVCGKDCRVPIRLIRLLVRESESIAAGEFLMRQWNKEHYKRLMRSAATDEMIEGSLDGRRFKRYEARFNPSILTSYLHLLISKSMSPDDHTSSPRIDRTNLAVRLLVGQSPRYPPAWNTVLSGLTTSIGSYKLRKVERWKRALVVWRLFKASKTYAVPADTETLRLLCVAAEKALFLSQNIDRHVLWDGVEPVDRVVSTFTSTFDLNNEQEPGVPPLLIPELATLHAYVRLLGFTGRHGEIIKLLKWMHAGAMSVEGIMGRRVLVACRVFLRDEAISEAEVVVESWLGEGGWPEQQEVEDYCIRGWRGRAG